MNKKALSFLLIIVMTMFLPFSFPVATAATNDANTMAIKPTKWWFSISSEEGYLTKNDGVLMLHLKNPSITALPTTSHTYRNVSLQEFVHGWAKGGHSYAKENPNGTLNYMHGKSVFKAVTFSKPVVQGSTLSINIQPFKQSGEVTTFNTPLKYVSLQIEASDPAFFNAQ